MIPAKGNKEEEHEIKGSDGNKIKIPHWSQETKCDAVLCVTCYRLLSHNQRGPPTFLPPRRSYIQKIIIENELKKKKCRILASHFCCC
jgi:hypothetical protein